MNNKPQLIDPSVIKFKRPSVKKRIRISNKHSKGFSLDIALLAIFLLFGVYLYVFRKKDTQQVQNKTKLQLQHMQNLNYQYFTNNYDKNILSYCSPQVYNILASKLCMNSPFLEFYEKTVI